MNDTTARRVDTLKYGVHWRSQASWAPEAFPVELHMRGWILHVEERGISAQPSGTKFYDEGSARADLEPQLEAWAAELAVIHDLPLDFWFMDADLVVDAFLVATARAEVSIGDRAGAVDEIRIKRIRAEVPVPTWTKPPSSLARDAREYCLVPMRHQRRNEADAAYWLSEQLPLWASSREEAADWLNLSHSVVRQMKVLSGQAYERKAGRGSRNLSTEERDLLRRMVELIVRRLHLYEVGEPVGEHVTIDGV